MNRSERLALCLERLSAEVDLTALVDTERLLTGEPEELLVAAARIEGALPTPSAVAEVELALLFLAAGDYARAYRHAEEAAAPGRGDPDVEARGHALLGRLAEVSRDPRGALEHYRVAAELNPRSWRHHLDLAAVLTELPEPAGWDEAAEALSAASALAGEIEAIALVRAQLMVRTGDAEGARRTLVGLVHEGSDRFAAMAAALLARFSAGES